MAGPALHLREPVFASRPRKALAGGSAPRRAPRICSPRWGVHEVALSAGEECQPLRGEAGARGRLHREQVRLNGDEGFRARFSRLVKATRKGPGESHHQPQPRRPHKNWTDEARRQVSHFIMSGRACGDDAYAVGGREKRARAYHCIVADALRRSSSSEARLLRDVRASADVYVARARIARLLIISIVSCASLSWGSVRNDTTVADFEVCRHADGTAAQLPSL